MYTDAPGTSSSTPCKRRAHRCGPCACTPSSTTGSQRRSIGFALNFVIHGRRLCATPSAIHRRISSPDCTESFHGYSSVRGTLTIRSAIQRSTEVLSALAAFRACASTSSRQIVIRAMNCSPSSGSTAHDTIYAISPRCGGTTSSPTQISRISVTSMSKYSAYPVHTPAIFLPASIRRSLRGATVSPPAAAADGTAEPTPVGRPAVVQKRAESSSFTPHRVQNISCKDYITTHLSAAGVFRHVQGLERRRETRKQSFRRVSNARVEMGEEKS